MTQILAVASILSVAEQSSSFECLADQIRRCELTLPRSALIIVPAFFRLQELAFVKRNENAVSSLLKCGPARCDCIVCGIALNQGPAASRLDGPQLVFSLGPLINHS